MVPLSDALAHALVGGCPDAVLLVTATGTIRYANPSATSLLGYDPEDLLGQNVEVLLPEGARGVHPGQMAGYAKEPTARAMDRRRELHARHKDGSLIDVDIMLSPLSFEEPMVGVYIRDITALRRAEAQVARTIDKLNEAHERLAELVPELESV